MYGLKRRVLYLIPDGGIALDGTKGAAVHVRAFSSAMENAGHEVFIACARPGARKDDPRVWKLRVRHADGERARGEARARGVSAALQDQAAEIARWCDVDLVVERLSLFPGGGRRVADALGATHVMEVNAPLADEAATHRGLVAVAEARDMERSAIRAADAVVVVSRELARWTAELRGDSAGVLHLPNGVEVSRFRVETDARAWSRREVGARPDDTVVAFVGTLKPWHGLDLLASAFSAAAASEPGLRLLLIGDGPERAALRSALDQSTLRDRVHFTGLVPPDEVPRWLAGADVGVAPYPPHEGFYFSPLKVGEYAAAGLAVVMSDLPDLVDLLPEPGQAIRVPAGDAKALAHALTRVARDVGLREQLKRSAKERADTELDWSARVDDFERHLTDCVGSSSGRGLSADRRPIGR